MHQSTSETEYRKLFADSPSPMWIHDRETHHFIVVNEATVAQYGYSREEFARMTIFDIRPTEEHERFREELAAPRRDVERSGPWLHRRKDGSVFEVDVDSHLTTWQGRPAVFVAGRDVTDRNRVIRENEQLNKELQSLLDASGDLGKELSEDAVAQHIVGGIRQIFPDIGSILLWRLDEVTGELDLAAGDVEPEHGHRKMGSELRKIFERKEPVILEGAAARSVLGNERPPGDLALAVPLLMEENLVGALLVTKRSEGVEIGTRVIRLLQALASHGAIALKNASMLKHIRRIPHDLIRAQEEERRRLAHELHDEVGAMLTSLGLGLSVIGSFTHDERVLSRLRLAEELVDNLTEEVRGLALRLRPSILDDLGLLPALQWFVKRYEKQTGIAVNFCHDLDQENRFSPIEEITAFRIVQEALTNTARHAQTSWVELVTKNAGRNLRIHINDGGSGFDPEEVMRRRNSVGLVGMRERVALLNGSIEIISAPGEGTRVSVVLPTSR